MSAKRWFLPETADLLGLLRLQGAITVEAMEALVAWSGGDPTAAVAVRDCEHRADETSASSGGHSATHSHRRSTPRTCTRSRPTWTRCSTRRRISPVRWSSWTWRPTRRSMRW